MGVSEHPTEFRSGDGLFGLVWFGSVRFGSVWFGLVSFVSFRSSAKKDPTPSRHFPRSAPWVVSGGAF